MHKNTSNNQLSKSKSAILKQYSQHRLEPKDIWSDGANWYSVQDRNVEMKIMHVSVLVPLILFTPFLYRNMSLALCKLMAEHKENESTQVLMPKWNEKKVSHKKKEQRLNKHVKNPEACFFSKSSKNALENVQVSEKKLGPTKVTAAREALWKRRITVSNFWNSQRKVT